MDGFIGFSAQWSICQMLNSSKIEDREWYGVGETDVLFRTGFVDRHVWAFAGRGDLWNPMLPSMLTLTTLSPLLNKSRALVHMLDNSPALTPLVGKTPIPPLNKSPTAQLPLWVYHINDKWVSMGSFFKEACLCAAVQPPNRLYKRTDSYHVNSAHWIYFHLCACNCCSNIPKC